MIKFRELINLTSRYELSHFVFLRRPYTKFRLIGTFEMFVKIIRLNAILIDFQDLSLSNDLNNS